MAGVSFAEWSQRHTHGLECIDQGKLVCAFAQTGETIPPIFQAKAALRDIKRATGSHCDVRGAKCWSCDGRGWGQPSAAARKKGKQRSVCPKCHGTGMRAESGGHLSCSRKSGHVGPHQFIKG